MKNPDKWSEKRCWFANRTKPATLELAYIEKKASLGVYAPSDGEEKTEKNAWKWQNATEENEKDVARKER